MPVFELWRETAEPGENPCRLEDVKSNPNFQTTSCVKWTGVIVPVPSLWIGVEIGGTMKPVILRYKNSKVLVELNYEILLLEYLYLPTEILKRQLHIMKVFFLPLLVSVHRTPVILVVRSTTFCSLHQGQD